MSDQERWLIAVFESESTAQDAARTIRRTSCDPERLRVGDPIDALTSFRGEMREEVNDRVTQSSGRGAVVTLALAASAGTTVAVPDTARARHVLLRAGSVRIDVIGPDGRPVDTLRARRVALRPPQRHTRRYS